MKALIVAEYYPRAADPVRGIWTHRQTMATREAGVELRVIVLYRPLPPLAALGRHDLGAISSALRQPAYTQLDGVEVEYLRYLSPPRRWSYDAWGRWAAPPLKRRLRALRQRFDFDLIHAHYAVPAADAVRRADPASRLVVSVHGHDVYGDLARSPNVHSALADADLVLANSAGTAERSRECGARSARVVHLGTDVPDRRPDSPSQPTLVTVGHLAARKRHKDVLSAVAQLKPGHPQLRYVIIGDGPERAHLEAQAQALGLGTSVEFRGQLPHAEAVAAARAATAFVMPSVDEAFGVAYVEAMAGGVPAIGCRGESGPQEIAASGEGILLVDPGDVNALVEQLAQLLASSHLRATLGACARETVQRHFTWSRCGKETVAAYEEVLKG